jgi:hypothetical protein
MSTVKGDGHVHEFDCEDCGVHVLSFGPAVANDNPVCAQCTWIRSMPNEADRKRLREFLGVDKMSRDK